MASSRVEVLLSDRISRIPLIAGVEISEQRALKGRLTMQLDSVLGRFQMYPTLSGLEVTTYPPNGRKIHLTPEGISFEPPGTQHEWGTEFSLRTQPPSLVFSDNTEIQVLPG